ncbi:MAG: DNA-processing protein DprA [Candidatus Caccovivens sp.]
MTEKDKLLVFMSMFEIANKKQERILEILSDFSIENALRNSEVATILSQEEYHKMIESYDLRALDSMIENMFAHDIQIITIFDDNYPNSLYDLPDRPLVLYAKGDLSLLDKKCFAVVGTRTPSNYGRIVTERFVETLALAGFVIVSGLGYGIDSIAHRKTLELGAKTISVIGSGFSNIYPAINTSLANEIAERGLLLSEYPPSFKPKRYTFPRRNRIVAGISCGVLIPEASIKSGTIYTKDFAIDYGKDVFTVPGNIYNEKSELPNHMIKTGQAHCVLDANDIVDFYGLQKQTKESVAIELTFDQKTILDLLSNGEKDFDYLAEKSKIPVSILNSCLTTLEISGLIRRLPAKTYCLA